MGFDYGAELYTPVADAIKQYCGTGKRTLLLDADFICYLVGFTSEDVEYCTYLRGGKEAEEIWESKKVHALQTIDKAVRSAKCDSVVLFLTDSSNNFRLQVATSQVYKGERIEEKPPFFKEVKEYLLEFPNARLSDGCEADDEISIESWDRINRLKEEGIELEEQKYKVFSDFVISSQDKDLDMIPSMHCHPTTGEYYWASYLGELTPVYKVKMVNDYQKWPCVNGEPVNPETTHLGMEFDRCNIKKEYGMVETGELYKRGAKKGEPKMKKAVIKVTSDIKYKRVKVGEKESLIIKKLKGTGLHFFYAQLLMGDTVDNYAGLKGWGGTGAYELLKDSESEQELYDKVSGAYEEQLGEGYFPYLLEQMQLAWMQTYKGEMFHPKERGLIK